MLKMVMFFYLFNSSIFLNVNVATNGVLNISSVQDSKSVQMKSSTKGLFSSSVSASTKATTGLVLKVERRVF
jgi:hypothetical protein